MQSTKKCDCCDKTSECMPVGVYYRVYQICTDCDVTLFLTKLDGKGRPITPEELRRLASSLEEQPLV